MQKPQRILLALGLSSSQAGRLMAHALMLARAFEARLHVVHVRGPVPAVGGFMKRHQREAAAERDAKARKQIEALIGKQGAAGVDVAAAIEEGRSVGDAIADYAAAHDIDLVLAGASQKSKARRFLGGGEAEGIAKAVPGPVFIIKP